MHVNNYTSANLLACTQFISDPFPWKRTGLARAGGERQSLRAKQGAQVRVSEDQGGKPPRGSRPGGQRPGGSRARSTKRVLSPQERESLVLRTYIVGGIGDRNYPLFNG